MCHGTEPREGLLDAALAPAAAAAAAAAAAVPAAAAAAAVVPAAAAAAPAWVLAVAVAGEAETASLEGGTRTAAARIAGAAGERVPAARAEAEWAAESVLALWECGWVTGTLGMKPVGLLGVSQVVPAMTGECAFVLATAATVKVG